MGRQEWTPPRRGFDEHMGYYDGCGTRYTHVQSCCGYQPDQRNAGGGSIGPVQVDDPWGAFAEDQLNLLDHLGVQQFGFIGFCIGGPFALKLAERAPNRIVAAVLCQPVGSNAAFVDSMYDSGQNQWGPGLQATRPDLTQETIDSYLHNLYRDLEPDFVYSVSRDFVRSCSTNGENVL